MNGVILIEMDAVVLLAPDGLKIFQARPSGLIRGVHQDEVLIKWYCFWDGERFNVEETERGGLGRCDGG